MRRRRRRRRRRKRHRGIMGKGWVRVEIRGQHRRGRVRRKRLMLGGSTIWVGGLVRRFSRGKEGRRTIINRIKAFWREWVHRRRRRRRRRNR